MRKFFFSDCENWYGIGDGFCDDISNNYECRFDGGDCCLNPVINKYSCNECICHAENKTYPVTNKIKKFTIGPTFPCEYMPNSNFPKSPTVLITDCQYIHQHKIDDGYCNDEVNMMAECDYDGGDCCLAEIDDLKCDECICHQDGSRHPTNLCTEYLNKFWIEHTIRKVKFLSKKFNFDKSPTFSRVFHQNFF